MDFVVFVLLMICKLIEIVCGSTMFCNSVNVQLSVLLVLKSSIDWHWIMMEPSYQCKTDDLWKSSNLLCDLSLYLPCKRGMWYNNIVSKIITRLIWTCFWITMRRLGMESVLTLISILPDYLPSATHYNELIRVARSCPAFCFSTWQASNEVNNMVCQLNLAVETLIERESKLYLLKCY